MFSIRFRLPDAEVGILIIVIVFTVALLRLGYPPEVAFALVAGAVAITVKAARFLAPRQQEA
jgi:hydrogenase/urease accessory protein HupE